MRRWSRRQRSRRRVCVRACVCARACGRGGCPRGAFQCTRREPRRAAVGAAVRSQGVMWGDADFCHEAGPSVQMMRVRFCLEAAEKPSYPAAYGILSMRMWSFARSSYLRCVASPYDGPSGNLSPGRRRRARSMFDGAARRAPGGVPSLVGGGLPPCPARVEPSLAGERDALPSWHSSPRVLDTPEQWATMTS